MKPTNIAKIRQLLLNAQVQVGATIEWAKYPGGAEEHGNKAMSFLEQALALLPCKTCGDSGRVPTFDQVSGLADADPCPDCQS